MAYGGSVELPVHILEMLGEYKAAIKDVTAEARKLKAEAKGFEKTGQVAPQHISERLNQLEVRRDYLTNMEAQKVEQRHSREILTSRLDVANNAARAAIDGNIPQFLWGQFLTGGGKEYLVRKGLNLQTRAKWSQRYWGRRGEELTEKFNRGVGSMVLEDEFFTRQPTPEMLDSSFKRGVLSVKRALYKKFPELSGHLFVGQQKLKQASFYALRAGAATAEKAGYLMQGLGAFGGAVVRYMPQALATAAILETGAYLWQKNIDAQQEANSIYDKVQQENAELFNKWKYGSGLSVENMARLNQVFNETHGSLMNDRAMGWFTNERMRNAGIQAGYQNKLQTFKNRYGVQTLNQLELDTLRNDRNIQQKLDRERGEWSAQGGWAAPVGWFSGHLKHGVEKLVWWVSGSDWEEQERMRLAVERGTKMQETIDHAREAKTKLITQRPEYKSHELQTKLHYRALEEMRLHRQMVWSPY